MSDAVTAAEAMVLDLTRRLTLPEERECLYCYVARMVDDHGCDNTLRWAVRFRDLRAPRAKALAERLGRMGGFCDCEMFLNGVTLAGRAPFEEDAWCDCDGWCDCRQDDVADPVERRLPCLGVRAGSTRGCGQWSSLRRW